MVDQPKDQSGRHSRSQHWSSHLAAVISTAERLIGPPLGSNEKLSQFLRRVAPLFDRLGHLTEGEFVDVLQGLASKSPKGGPVDQKVRADIENISLEEIERRLSDPTVTKTQLLDLVRYRFRGPTGTLTRLSREALIDRINTFVMNERGHQTVARLAGNEEFVTPRTDNLSETSKSLTATTSSNTTSEPKKEQA